MRGDFYKTGAFTTFCYIYYIDPFKTVFCYRLVPSLLIMTKVECP